MNTQNNIKEVYKALEVIADFNCIGIWCSDCPMNEIAEVKLKNGSLSACLSASISEMLDNKLYK